MNPLKATNRLSLSLLIVRGHQRSICDLYQYLYVIGFDESCDQDFLILFCPNSFLMEGKERNQLQTKIRSILKFFVCMKVTQDSQIRQVYKFKPTDKILFNLRSFPYRPLIQMFGIFKKKEASKTVEKGKPIEKQPSGKKIQAIIQTNKPKNIKKQSQKLISINREQTQGQFIQKKKVKKASQIPKQQEKPNSVTTPKIQTKKNIKEFEEKDTQRPHKILTQPYELEQSKQVPADQELRFAKYEQDYYEDVRPKQVINLKSINKLLTELKNLAEGENEIVITKNFSNKKVFNQVHLKLFYSKYFRFYQLRNINDLIQRYGQIIQGLELLISKLSNRIGKGVHFHKTQAQNEQKLQTIYVKDQSQFLLFFKHFFSKPYTLCNRPSVRKILQALWQSIIFKTNNVKKVYEQLKLWIYGISIPSNPSLIILHKIILQSPQAIPKYAKMIFNDKIYMGINEVDSLIKAPLTIAMEIQSKKAIQKLIKCGANPHLSPCISKKGQYSFEYSQTKYKKHIFTINFPHYSKKVLSPMETLLFLKQDLSLLNDTMYFIQIANIRKLRKQTEKIKEKLKQIPDCTFQIAWKTYRGILSFKQLPSDIITFYKKDSRLRIDYNIDSVENPVKGKHFTILIKVENEKPLEFYQIRHHSKTILNKMAEIDMSVIKEKVNEFCSYPQARNSQISQCKGMFEKKDDLQGKKLRMDINLSIYNETVTPQNKKTTEFKKPTFKSTLQYEKAILDSQLIDYKSMEKSQLQAVVQQNIVYEKNLPLKLKSKVQKSNVGLEIQFEEEKLNLRHLEFMMSFFKTDSVLMSKLLNLMKVFQNQDVFGNVNIFKYLPVFSKINLERDLTFQMDIKNLNFVAINDNLFNVECKVISDMNYGENLNPRALDSMQQTMLMEEGYSINVSQFLGKTQKMLQLEEEYAREKFEKMLEEQFCNERLSINDNILDDLGDD